MDIWEIDKLALFLLFFIPGFISIKTYQLIVASDKFNFTESLAEAVGFSSINFAFFSWAIILIHKNDFPVNHPFWYYLISFVIIFIAPIFWSVLFVILTKAKILRKWVISPVKTAWDFYFEKRKSFWVIVNLTDGEKIGGVYSFNSFSSSYPAKEQIYLEELWEINNDKFFIKKIDRSQGIIILGEQIKSIEFYI